jgi:hypothetical protein
MQVWYVRGDEDKLLFVEKLDAERHARYIFPDEDAHRRYARIYYRTVYKYVLPPGAKQSVLVET